MTVSEATRTPRTTVVETVKIRDEGSGRELTLKGYGAMRGKFVIKHGVDVTKPIAEQAVRKANTKPKGKAASSKAASKAASKVPARRAPGRPAGKKN